MVIKRLCLIFLLFAVLSPEIRSGVSAVEALSVASAQGQRQKLDTAALWKTVRKATTQRLRSRRQFAAKLHAQLTATPESQKEERGHIFAALSVLHASDPLLAHSSLSYLAAAARSWPSFVRTDEAWWIWQQMINYLDRKQIVNEHMLSRVAAILANGVVGVKELNHFPYYTGWSLFREGKYGDALSMLERVPLGSPHYRRAKFLEATSQVMLGRIADAREIFQIVVSMAPTEAEAEAGFPRRSIQRLRDLGVLNIARLLYERSQFAESLAYYRALDQDSFFFYESLAEQGWSFFMAGYPARGLGAAYAATSPFYSDRFNPDVYFLLSTLYFWLCHYDYSRAALARFIDHSRAEGDSLRIALSGIAKLKGEKKRTRLLSLLDAADQGLNPKHLGLGEKTMAYMISQEGLMDSYAGFLALRDRRLKVADLGLEKTMHNRIQTAIEEYETELADQVALQAEDTLIGLRDAYDHALVQSRLLWLEILTAQKDQLLGQGRTVTGNQYVGDERTFIDALTSGKSTKWRQDRNEFWFDELGSYVFDMRSKCQVEEKSAGLGTQR